MCNKAQCFSEAPFCRIAANPECPKLVSSKPLGMFEITVEKAHLRIVANVRNAPQAEVALISKADFRRLTIQALL